MFVISIKASKLKWWVLGGAGILATVLLLSSALRPQETASTAAGVSVTAETNAQRRGFLTQYGWEAAEDPTEIQEILIPEVFNQTYEDYNAIQKAQGFDLSKYQGKRVKKWVYSVENYPGQTGNVIATLLIRDGKIIGGDISSESADGFQHGFDPNSAGIGADLSSLSNETSQTEEISDEKNPKE